MCVCVCACDKGSTAVLPCSLQCSDYMNGQVTGGLCEPLCVRREVEFVRCVGRGIAGVKRHVLQAQWAANTVILKTLTPVGSSWFMDHAEQDLHQKKITKEEFIQNVST